MVLLVLAVVLVAAAQRRATSGSPGASPTPAGPLEVPPSLRWPAPYDEWGVSPLALRAGPDAYALIRRFEGLHLTAYWDNGQYAIGYGHRGPDVSPGQRITVEEAERLLQQDVAKAETVVRSLVTVPLTQAQFDALVSFVYNVGAGAFRSSTLLRLLNDGDYAGAMAEFNRWVYSDGRVLPGLVARREAEAALFERGMA